MTVGYGTRIGPDGKERPALFLALQLENVMRLLNDNPINLTPETHPVCREYLGGMEVFICVAEPAEIVTLLQRAGAVTPETDIRFDGGGTQDK